MVIYTVVWNNNGVFAYKTREEAIDLIETISGKNERDWEYDNGSYDDYGNSISLYEAELTE